MFSAALVKRFFDDECVLFVQTKKGAHRMRLVLNLLAVKAGELHGNLTQPQVRNPSLIYLGLWKGSVVQGLLIYY